MMTITTQKDWCDGHDAFKVTGTIETGGGDKKSKTTIFAYGKNKNEAVAKAISEIDALLGYLKDSKNELAGI